VQRLAPLGVRLVQLRIKERPDAWVAEQIRLAQACCRTHGMQLIVNDYWRLALAAGCDFVHLGQADLEGADLGALRRAGVRVGVSTHDAAELERAQGSPRTTWRSGPSTTRHSR
jgi:thiamine-phosphate pyrophosphorylase